MKCISTILVLFLVLKCNYASECGITNAKVCFESCKCWNPCRDNNTLVIDCSHINQIPSKWPETLHLTASFANNPIRKLQKIPPTSARTVSLTFKNCSLEEIDKDLFIDVVNIEYLDLSWNLLKDIFAENFRGQYSNDLYEPIALLELNLSHNMITSLHHNIFEHTPKLEKLDLSSNPLERLDGTWDAITSLSALNWLNLANTSIATLPETDLPTPPPLKYFDLSNNKFTTVPTELAVFRNSLEKIRLSENLITELNDQSLLGLSSLTELRIDHMPNLRNIKHNSFSGLKHLRVLYLNNNKKLSHINEGAFGIDEGQPPLEEIALNALLNNERRLYRRQGEQSAPFNFATTVSFGGGSIMVWGGICLRGRTELVVIDGGALTADRYIRDILQDHVVPFAPYIGENFTLMQDNAHPHVAHCVTDFLNQVYLNNNNLRVLSDTIFKWSDLRVLQIEGNHWACKCENPPCNCPHINIEQRNLPVDTNTKESYLLIPILIPVLLFVSCGLFLWRLLVRNRRHRLVNSMYPVIYTTAPMSAPN